VSGRQNGRVEVRLVRHACAGVKEEWEGPDELRPLDEAGHLQARALSQHLVPSRPTQLVSSPALRCVETLKPSAVGTGLDVTLEPALARTATRSEALEYVFDEGCDGAVLCTHGEILEFVLGATRAHEATIVAEQSDDEWLLLKGSVWTLDISDARVWSLRHQIPVPVPECPRHASSE
jgi:phosphohistidine phosphatase SixA